MGTKPSELRRTQPLPSPGRDQLEGHGDLPGPMLGGSMKGSLSVIWALKDTCGQGELSLNRERKEGRSRQRKCMNKATKIQRDDGQFEDRPLCGGMG